MLFDGNPTRADLMAERDALAAQNERLRAALEAIHKGACLTAQDSRSREDDRYCIADVMMTARDALALTPPAALEELRRRLTEEESNRWITALRTLDLGLCDFIDEGDIESYMAAWLEELRRRERSIGAEAELRAFAKDLREVPEEGIDIYERLVMTGARDQNESSFAEQGAQKMECSIRYKILSRADQIRVAREKGGAE
jgi:hypothetical protein